MQSHSISIGITCHHGLPPTHFNDPSRCWCSVLEDLFFSFSFPVTFVSWLKKAKYQGTKAINEKHGLSLISNPFLNFSYQCNMLFYSSSKVLWLQSDCETYTLKTYSIYKHIYSIYRYTGWLAYNRYIGFSTYGINISRLKKKNLFL